MINHLRDADDEEFDGLYLHQQKLAHRETLALFEGFNSSHDHPGIVAYARAMLTRLRQHQEMVERIEDSGRLRS